MAKIDEKIVYDMREMRSKGMRLEDIAKKYGLNNETVRAVVNLTSWRHVRTPYDKFLAESRGKINRGLPPMEYEEITAEFVRRIFTYDPEEGILRWNIRGPAIKFGQPAGCMAFDHLEVAMGCQREYAARVIWLYMTGAWPDGLVDHEDQDKLNNKWDNLREATKSQNAMNSKKRTDNTSGYRGVYLHKRVNRYVARITKDQKEYSLGMFEKFEDAVAARKKAEQEMFGEFAPKDP